MPDTDKQAEQRKQVWSAAQTLIGWAVLIGLLVFGYRACGWIPDSVADGPDIVRLYDRQLLHDTLFWSALFAVPVCVMPFAFVRTNFGAVLAGIVVVGIVVAYFALMYTRVAAVAFVGNALELRYLWPRGPIAIPAADIVKADYETGVRAGVTGNFTHQLDLRTRRGDFASFDTVRTGDVVDAVRRINAMRAGAPEPRPSGTRGSETIRR